MPLTQPVIDELLKDIARRIKDAGAITDTAEYQIYRAQALGESKQAIKAAVARQIKAQDKVIDSLFDYILDNSTPPDRERQPEADRRGLRQNEPPKDRRAAKKTCGRTRRRARCCPSRTPTRRRWTLPSARP